ncbi:MAG: zinc ribbon domain-containing protein [Atopobiaceae bacterium]|nr:zinc ribbon domain-containing protein [Atopobiaceae bacterium]
MNCPNCGAPIPPTASFCPNCGCDLRQQPVSVGIPGRQAAPVGNDSSGRPADPRGTAPRRPQGFEEATTAGGPHRDDRQSDQGGHQRSKLSGGAKTAIVVAVLMLVLVSLGFVLLFTSLVGNVSLRATQSTHPVTFVVSILDYDDESSRIPVHITGTDIHGDEVDRTIFLAHSGVDVELLKGRYHAEVLGSPISSSGMIYEVPTTTIDFTLGDDLEPGEGYRMPSSLSFVFRSIDAQNMTDDKIADALSWARKDEEAGLDVGKLEAAAKARQQSGLEEQSAEPEPEPQEPPATPEDQQPVEEQPQEEQPQDNPEPSAE